MKQQYYLGLNHSNYIFMWYNSFKVMTDHKPLIHLFTQTSKPPPRIERRVLRLSPYQFTVQYRLGQSNTADHLSQTKPLHYKDSHHSAKEYVHLATQLQTPTTLLNVIIMEHTKNNHLIQY